MFSSRDSRPFGHRPSRRVRLRSLLTAAAMLTGALAMAPAAQAAGPAADPAQAPVSANAARSTNVVVHNQTGQGMQRVWTNLDHGCWTNGQLPVDYIPAGVTTSWASESCGALTGTEGSANFSVAGGQVQIHWNNPYAGSNSYSCDVPSGYYCQRRGGSGNNAGVEFTISGGPRTLAAPQPAAGPATIQAARSTQVTLNNSTGGLLARTDSGLSHGIWSDNQLPPVNIMPGQRGTWQSESDGFLTGTQGYATYQVQGGGHVTVQWNNPYSGSNSYSCTAPAGRTCTRTGGSGNNAAVAFTLS
ncbi:Crystal protein ET79 [Streptomyces sp. NPDC097617]|uniref:Crystal protein ET79 n=1 Tax=Streptomyces sp. NPDC097617 TaxID=3366091 RepID=UPI0037F1F3C6